jgi:hypothetical protein
MWLTDFHKVRLASMPLLFTTTGTTNEDQKVSIKDDMMEISAEPVAP